jgi:DNA-binding SARP family transcriptional activator
MHRTTADLPAPTARSVAGQSIAVQGLRLNVLSGFELVHRGAAVPLPLSVQRIIALLALHGRPLQRVYVAGVLWINSSEAHANASLRTTLWRTNGVAKSIVQARGQWIGLVPGVDIDLREATGCADRALGGRGTTSDDLAILSRAGDVLPDWYEDWVVIERERFRQLRLHALERLCETLAADRRFAEATSAGLSAIAGEPLRESAHRVLIAAYLAEGNVGEAVRHYRLFARLLHRQLQLRPSPQMNELMAPVHQR